MKLYSFFRLNPILKIYIMHVIIQQMIYLLTIYTKLSCFVAVKSKHRHFPRDSMVLLVIKIN